MITFRDHELELAIRMKKFVLWLSINKLTVLEKRSGSALAWNSKTARLVGGFTSELSQFHEDE